MMKLSLEIKIAIISFALLGLTACSAEAPPVAGDYPDITLAQSKSPTQLLRNETASHIPEEQLDEVVQTGDTTVSCLPADADPQGTIRSWQSTIKLTIVESETDSLNSIVEALVDTLEEQGWGAPALGGTARDGSKLLYKELQLQSIQIVGLKPNDVRPEVSDEVAVDQASIVIVVNGPCVRTDGEGSDELKKLEQEH